MRTMMRAVVLSAAGLVLAAGSPAALGAERADGKQASYVVVTDGQTVNVEVREGIVKKLTVNGEEIPTARVQHEGSTLKVLGEDGRVIATVRLESGAEGRGAAERGRAAAAMSRDVARRAREAAALARERVRAHAGAHGQAGAQASGQAGATQRVMLGVTPEEPGDALAAQLGLKSDEVTVLTSVSDNMPAAKAGLRAFDVVVAIDGKTPADPDTLRKAIRARKPGDELSLSIVRAGQKQDVKVKLDAVAGAEEGAEDERDMNAWGEEFREAFKDMPKQFEEAFKDMPHEIEIEDGSKGRARVYRFNGGPGVPPVPPVPGVPGGDVLRHLGPGSAPFIVMGEEGRERLTERLERLDERFDRLEEQLDKLAELLERIAEKQRP